MCIQAHAGKYAEGSQRSPRRIADYVDRFLSVDEWLLGLEADTLSDGSIKGAGKRGGKQGKIEAVGWVHDVAERIMLASKNAEATAYDYFSNFILHWVVRCATGGDRRLCNSRLACGA